MAAEAVAARWPSAGLLIRRTRAVALALALQLVQLMRGGYLPYPYVIAMIPFAALTVAGVADWVWSPRRRADPGPGSTARWRTALRYGRRVAVAAVCGWLVVVVGQAWRVPLHDLRTQDRDAGKAEALAWVVDNVPRSAYVVVDDSLWVDLVRSGFPRDHVIWFTKLDVDKDVRLPASPQWTGIDYIVLDQQDDLSVHVQDDGLPSKDTLALFPTLGRALDHAAPVRTFGLGLDRITVRQVDPHRPGHRKARS